MDGTSEPHALLPCRHRCRCFDATNVDALHQPLGAHAREKPFVVARSCASMLLSIAYLPRRKCQGQNTLLSNKYTVPRHQLNVTTQNV